MMFNDFWMIFDDIDVPICEASHHLNREILQYYMCVNTCEVHSSEHLETRMQETVPEYDRQLLD